MLEARDEHNVPRRAGIGCKETLDLIPAMALGPIDTAERMLVQSHCDRCPACATELAALSQLAAFLPYAAPASAPRPQAKLALFDRIASAEHPVAPEIAAAAVLPDVWIDDPSDKRRAQSTPATSSTGIVPTSRISGRMSKLAVAPLAIALMLVSVYAMQTRNDVQDLRQENVVLTSASLISPKSADLEGETVAADTAPSISTTVEAVTNQLLSSQLMYSFSGSSIDSPTESSRLVTPRESTCQMAGYGNGQYHLRVAGVDLPNGAREAGVYLETTDGARELIARVSISTDGSGDTIFTLHRPISDFRSLLIGPLGAGADTAEQPMGATTFMLTTEDAGSMGLTANS